MEAHFGTLILKRLKDELEKVKNRAARFVTRIYVYETWRMTGILGQLKCKSLKKEKGLKTHCYI